MHATKPLAPSTFHVKRYHLEVLSGPQRGVRRDADEDGRVHVGRAASGHDAGAATGAWLWLDDPMVSQVHLTFEAQPTCVLMRDVSRNGTWLGGVRLCGHPAELTETLDLRVGETDLRVVVEGRDRPVAAPGTFGGLLGTSPSMQRLFARLERLAACDLPVLITGETGTGKSALARALHDRSRRAGKEFLEVDFGSLSPQLMAAELFGSVRGAFTGAVDRKGMLEEAQGGTVLLDEVGDLALDYQPQLLRVLDRKRLRRLGSNEERAINVRVIAATYHDLPAMVNEGRFRLDLYERLAVCMVEMPPLRERREEIPALARHLIGRIRDEGSVSVPPGFELTPEEEYDLMRRDWYGNVRELYHYLSFKLATGENPPLRKSRPTGATTSSAIETEDLLDRPYKDASEELSLRFDRTFLRHHYERAGRKLGRAAAQAGLHRVTFTQKLERCGLKRVLGIAPDEGE